MILLKSNKNMMNNEVMGQVEDELQHLVSKQVESSSVHQNVNLNIPYFAYFFYC